MSLTPDELKRKTNINALTSDGQRYRYDQFKKSDKRYCTIGRCGAGGNNRNWPNGYTFYAVRVDDESMFVNLFMLPYNDHKNQWVENVNRSWNK